MIVQSYVFARRVKSQFFYVQRIYKETPKSEDGRSSRITGPDSDEL